MLNKEEDTALLLSQDELPTEDQYSVKYAKKKSFVAATLATSCLCGAGIFISSDKVWCHEPGVQYKETDLLRFCVLIGGILSALISGRAVDYYGRRSSVIFAAVCWLVAAVFLLSLSFPRTNSQSVLIGVSSQDLTSTLIEPSELSSTNLFNLSEKYISVSRSSLLNLYPLPTEPSSVHSQSSKHDSPDLDVPQIDYGKLYVRSPACGHSRSNDSFSSERLVVDKQPLSLLPRVICNLFIGAASSASVISASVYVFEISRASVRARWISVSDFFSIIFGLFLPVINSHILILTIVACLPVIILSLLLLFPLNFPNYLSLPNSPYHLILEFIIQKKKSCNSNSAVSIDNETTGKHSIYNPLNYFSYSSGKTTFSFTHIIKIPFYSSKSKIYDVNSRKDSAGDSDDGSFRINDVAKQSKLEIELDKFQTVCAEKKSSLANQSKVQFEEECQPHSGESVRSLGEKETERGCLEESALHREELDCSNVECDEGMLGGERSGGSLHGWEACKTLSYLYGVNKGEEEAEAIHKEFCKDVDAESLHTNKSYFILDMKHFQPILQTVLKIGIPLMVIHMCATDYDDVVAVSGAVMSKLSFCGISVTTAASTLKVICAALSMLLLDKIGHQRALLSAAAVLATSSLALGFLSPHVIAAAGGPPQEATATTPPSVPTLYPLLPTPLPQVLHRDDSSLLEDKWKDSHLFTQDGSSVHIYMASESPLIWLTVISVLSFIISETLVLAPLTRMTLLSAFPTSNRGSGIGISFAVQYMIHLVMFLLPCTFNSSSFALLFRSGACFSSIILLLCFLRTKSQAQRCSLQRYSCNKRFFHLLNDSKICNLSIANSTVV